MGIVVLLVVAAWGFLGTQRALDMLVERAVAESQGHLVVEKATGSLLDTVLVSRIAWSGVGMDVEARDAALNWSPWDLLSRRFIVRGLGAKEITIAFKDGGSSGSGGPPASLALPLEVEVRNIGVERLVWRTPTQQGTITGITFGYAGGARRHAIRDMRFVSEWGTLSGHAAIEATAPFALEGALSFEGDADYRGLRADLAVSGTLENIGIGAEGTWHDAKVAVKAGVTPFAPAIIASADVNASNVDLSHFLDNLPTTALTLTLQARPAGTGFAGTVQADNAAPGPVDRQRIPLRTLAAGFAWDGKSFALTRIDATLGERGAGGRATGDVTVTTPRGPVKVDLRLSGVDASGILTTLIATRLSGTLAAEVEEARQVVRGNLQQDDLAVDFAATIAARTVTLERMQARAGTGTLTGRATLGLDPPRAFTVDARTSGFDPSRFVDMPPAKLDGSVQAKGRLERPFAVTGDVTIAQGSRFAGLPLSGKARADVAPGTVRNAKVDATWGQSHVVMNGGYGTAQDSLAYDIDLRALAELRPLIERYAHTTVPKAFGGALHARGTVAGDPGAPGVTVQANGSNLVWGDVVRAGTITAKGSIAPGRNAAGPIALEQRALSLAVDATKLDAAGQSLATASARIDGSLAEHKATLAAKGERFDLAATARGGLAELRAARGTERGWRGTIETFTNQGTYAVTLTAPASLVASAHHVELGNATITIADGRMEVAQLVVDDGRVTTRGNFTRVPVVAVARLAGQTLPFHSTLVLGGNWDIAATPRLNGTLTIQRESGDWYATESARTDMALGITEFVVQARFTEDALAATARFRSLRAGTGDASFNLAAGSAPGLIEASSAFTASLTADLASLRPLQPWLGTAAVMDGRARLALTGRGTLAEPVLAGTVEGDALRFDLPQYGVHLRDGILRARLADNAIALDDLSFAGGAGRFKASGTIARPLQRDGAPTSTVQWQAQDFTIVNRPDLKLTADGKGTITLQNREVRLAGAINIDEGRVEYEPTRAGRLSDDVVIVGQPPREIDNGALPLALDLEVSLGRDFRFVGEGLDTRLAGRVKIVTSPTGVLMANGTIRAVQGSYYLFGQRLDIDRGRLIFDGPVANPALDVVALRRNLAVEAGVEVSGTVRQPRVRLVSNPPVSDGEKLSWILTGQGLDRAGRNDFALLGAASAQLLGVGNSKPITTQIANTIGLDDISVRGSDSAIAGSNTQVVAFGKRITDRLSLVYEQGLGIATNALRLEYTLSRSITLRAEAGTVSSVGIFFRRTFD